MSEFSNHPSHTGALTRRVHGRTSLYDYTINAVMPPLPLVSEEWLPIRGAFPAFLTFDTTKTRPVIEIGRFTDSYFNANVNAWKETLRSRNPIPAEVYHSLTALLSVPHAPAPHLPSSPSSSFLTEPTSPTLLSHTATPTRLPPYAEPLLAEPPTTLMGVAEWVYRYPLRTVEAISNLADFGFRKWEFLPELFEEISHGLFYTFTLAERPDSASSRVGSVEASWQNQLVVFVVPPWLMSLDDFREFVQVNAIRDFRTSATLIEKYGGETCYPTLMESLWMLILDYCEKREVQTFVLTSYNQWLFGGFTYEQDRCFARLSSVRNSFCTGPTIVQTLLFFMRSVEMRDLGLSSQWSSISWRTSMTARQNREEEGMEQRLLKRKVGSDVAQQAPNKRSSSSGSSSGSRSRGSSVAGPSRSRDSASSHRSYLAPLITAPENDMTTQQDFDPLAVGAFSSTDSAAALAWLASGSGSHRRRRNRSARGYLTRLSASVFASSASSSSSQAATSVPNHGITDPVNAQQQIVHVYSPSDSLHLAEGSHASGSQASTSSTSTSPSLAPPEPSLSPQTLSHPNVLDMHSSPFHSRSESSSMFDEEEEEQEENEVQDSMIGAGVSLAEAAARYRAAGPNPFSHLDGLQPDYINDRAPQGRDMQTPEPSTPAAEPPAMPRRGGPQSYQLGEIGNLWERYGQLPLGTPGTPTPGHHRLVRRHSDPSVVPLPAPTEDEADELLWYEESEVNAAASSSHTGCAAYPLQYEGAALTEQEMHDETAWNEHMRKVNWIREDPVFQFTRYTDVEMTPDPRDADMGPFELLQWDHIRQRNVSAGAQRGEASGSGSQSGSSSQADTIAAHFRSVQPVAPAVQPYQDVITQSRTHPWLDHDMSWEDRTRWTSRAYQRMLDDQANHMDRMGLPSQWRLEQMEREGLPNTSPDSSQEAGPSAPSGDGLPESTEELAGRSAANEDRTYESLYSSRGPTGLFPISDERRRSASIASGDASTLWDGEPDNRSAAATAIDPDEQRLMPDASPLPSPAAAPAVPLPSQSARPATPAHSIVETEADAEGEVDSSAPLPQIHVNPYRREFTPAPISEVYSFKSDFSTNTSLQAMRNDYMAMDEQLNDWRKVLPQDDHMRWFNEAELRSHMAQPVPRPRTVVRGHAPAPYAESSGIPSPALQWLDYSSPDVASVSPSAVSSPGSKFEPLIDDNSSLVSVSSPPA